MKKKQLKLYMRLFFAVIALVTAAVMVVTASYAWLSLSSAPEVSGAQVMIGGGNTILLAPDLTETFTNGEQSVTVHYPGAFSRTLLLSQSDPNSTASDALQALSGIEPVSTADGIYWLLPTYDERTGALNPPADFIVDSTLEYANQQGESSSRGGYIYLDFWIVSPGSEYTVRVSTDKQTQTGSALVEIPAVIEDENGGYALEAPSGKIASMARVGFLTNSASCATADVYAYAQSSNYNSQYSSLRGVFQEPGSDPVEGLDNRFTIYEPNGTLHPDSSELTGAYVLTSPFGYDPTTGERTAQVVRSILTVQTQSAWSEETPQLLSSALVGHEVTDAQSAWQLFFERLMFLQGDGCIRSGGFFTNTAALYDAADDGVVPAAEVGSIETAGATEDVYITRLERNTPQRIRMYIWLEGQDVDCAEATDASTFTLSLELAGGSE